MDQRWIYILVILVFYQKSTSGAGEKKTLKEGQSVDIKCAPNGTGSLVVWFRALDNSVMEFIASFSNNGLPKSASTMFSASFSDSKISQHILTLKSFHKATDSGIYGCGSLYKGVELKFGQVTQLVGEKSAVAKVTTLSPTKQNLCTTAPACDCNNNNKKGETSSSMFCSPIILGPLAGGCGLLLLLLIVTILYCNKIRTRRCPHHYKRKPRTTTGGKQMMTNRHI